MHTGSDSTSEKIEAPVVEKPEELSKKASANDDVHPQSKKGKEPIKLDKSHADATNR